MTHGRYTRPAPDQEQVVVLPADDESRRMYEAKGFEYQGEAPTPGHENNVPDAEVHAAEARRLRKA
jgi:hypothetical protein